MRRFRLAFSLYFENKKRGSFNHPLSVFYGVLLQEAISKTSKTIIPFFMLVNKKSTTKTHNFEKSIKPWPQFNRKIGYTNWLFHPLRIQEQAEKAKEWRAKLSQTEAVIEWHGTQKIVQLSSVGTYFFSSKIRSQKQHQEDYQYENHQ